MGGTILANISTEIKVLIYYFVLKGLLGEIKQGNERENIKQKYGLLKYIRVKIKQ